MVDFKVSIIQLVILRLITSVLIVSSLQPTSQSHIIHFNTWVSFRYYFSIINVSNCLKIPLQSSRTCNSLFFFSRISNFFSFLTRNLPFFPIRSKNGQHPITQTFRENISESVNKETFWKLHTLNNFLKWSFQQMDIFMILYGVGTCIKLFSLKNFFRKWEVITSTYCTAFGFPHLYQMVKTTWKCGFFFLEKSIIIFSYNCVLLWTSKSPSHLLKELL